VPGVYEQVWKDIAASHPAFVLSVGDLIEGTKDATAEAQWRGLSRIHEPYRRYPLFAAPGNHDVWSPASAALFQKHIGRPPHYGFDHGGAHFTVLDNSGADELSAAQYAFLEADLKAHSSARWKFVVFHRPSWIVPALFENPRFRLHQLARQYGVGFFLAGHVHQMVHVTFDGVTYMAAPSAGGHLRASRRYEDGWFYGHTVVSVDARKVTFEIRETGPPHGRARMTKLEAWGRSGLMP